MAEEELRKQLIEDLEFAESYARLIIPIPDQTKDLLIYAERQALIIDLTKTLLKELRLRRQALDNDFTEDSYDEDSYDSDPDQL